MILNADEYRINVKTIEYLTRGKTDKELLDFIGMVSIATSTHIILCCVYVGELYGFSEELLAFMERLKAYYRISEVRGVKWNS